MDRRHWLWLAVFALVGGFGLILGSLAGTVSPGEPPPGAGPPRAALRTESPEAVGAEAEFPSWEYLPASTEAPTTEARRARGAAGLLPLQLRAGPGISPPARERGGRR